jgi:hypothetical protein
MIFPSHSSSVPPFHSLGNGTVEQTLNQRNSPRNTDGTFSLKALANKVLTRNTQGNSPGTETSKSVLPLPQSSIACGTNGEVSGKLETEILDSFEERLAIAEYDGQQNPLQAQRIAYQDAFIAVLNTLSCEETEGYYDEDWLTRRIKAAQSWLVTQGLQQPE